MLHQLISNIDYLVHLNNNDIVEPLDRAVPFDQVPHTILSTHGGCRPSNLRIIRMLVTEGFDEADNTSR